MNRMRQFHYLFALLLSGLLPTSETWSEQPPAARPPPREIPDHGHLKWFSERRIQSIDNVSTTLERSRPAPHFTFADPLSQVILVDDQPLKDRLTERTGLELSLSFRSLVQGLSNVPGDKMGSSGAYKFAGRWTLVDRQGPNYGAAVFSMDQRFRYSRKAPDDLGDELELLFLSADAYNVRAFAIRQLYWEQALADGKIKMRLGKIDPTAFFNTNIVSDSSVYFLNQAFATNVGRWYPDEGLGFHFHVDLAKDWYAAVGVQDANANTNAAGFSTLKKGQMFGVTEIGWLPKFEGLGAGAYRFSFWGNEAATLADVPSGWGIALSADQDISETITLFLLASWQEGADNPVRAVASVGFLMQNMPGRPSDAWGAGVGAGTSADSDRGEEYATEIFYRFQLTPHITISPDLQLIRNPGGRSDPQWAVAGGVRARVAF